MGVEKEILELIFAGGLGPVKSAHAQELKEELPNCSHEPGYKDWYNISRPCCHPISSKAPVASPCSAVCSTECPGADRVLSVRKHFAGNLTWLW